jgi:stearoyl-CoA desaturase (delta-9 desaturase)
MALTLKFKILHFFTHLFSVIGLYWAISNHLYHWLWVAFFCYLFAGIFGVNISLHRYFAHKSFKTNVVGHWFLLLCSFFPMLGSPAAWGSVHRYHHANSDTPLDPHSPKYQGRFSSWFTFWPVIEIPLSTFRSFAKDKNVMFLHQWYFTLVIVYVLALALINLPLVCFVFAIPAVGCFHGAAAIAVIPHVDGIGGYKNHVTSDNSYNNFLAWILSLGEGWHNNHHFNPNKYRHGEKWWELDPPAFFIKHLLMKKK